MSMAHEKASSKDKTDIYQPDKIPDNTKNPPDSGLGTSQKATTSASGPGVNLTESDLLATNMWKYSYSGYIPGCDKLVPKLEEGELALPNTSQSLELRDYYRCVVPGCSPLILQKDFPYDVQRPEREKSEEPPHPIR